MARYIHRWLQEELPRLEALGVVTSDEARKIRNHYQQASDGKGARRVVAVFAAMGALLLGGGIILIVAHNWAEWSRVTRVSLALFPLLLVQAMAFWARRARPQSSAWKESIGVAWTLAIGVALALVSQTYHVWDMARFCLTWALSLLPVSYLWPAVFSVGMYPILILGWVFNAPEQWRILFWLWLGLGWPHVRGSRRRLSSPGGILAVIPYALAVALGGFAALGMLHESELLLRLYFGAVLTTWCLSSELPVPTRGAERNPVFGHIGRVGIPLMTLVLTYESSWTLGAHWVMRFGWRAWVELGVIVAWVGAAAVCSARTWTHSDWRRRIQAIWIVLLLVGEWLVYHRHVVPAVVMMNLYLLVWAAWSVADGVRNRDLGLANFGLLWFGALATARFFDADFTYIQRGLAFVVVGAVFLVANVFFRRAWRRTS